jgi:hypothetical protein
MTIRVGDTVLARYVLSGAWSKPVTVVKIDRGVYYLDGDEPPRLREDLRPAEVKA